MNNKIHASTKKFCEIIRKKTDEKAEEIKKRLKKEKEKVLAEFQGEIKGKKYNCPIKCTWCCRNLFKTTPYETSNNSLKKIFTEAIKEFSLKKEYKNYLKDIEESLKKEDKEEKKQRRKRSEYLSIVLPIIYYDIKEENRKLKKYNFNTKNELKEKIKELLKTKNYEKEKIVFTNCIFVNDYGCSIHNITRPKECEEYVCKKAITLTQKNVTIQQ